MIVAPVAPDEAERLADLRALKILDTPPEERFDRIVKLAARIFEVPIAYIALVDADRQWFKAKCGLRGTETDRDVSFCGHTILHDGTLIVPDSTLDERFRDNPLVVGEPYIRFYAGQALTGPAGRKVGTLCVADRRPRVFGESSREILRRLAALAEHELRLVDLIGVQHQLLETRNALAETQRRLAAELAQAAGYVRSLLPLKLDGVVRTDWRFINSSQLGGDLFGYDWLDDRHLALYLLDVCGHGIGASLLSISVHTALRRRTLPETDFHDPAAVLAALNRTFPMEEHDGRFCTLWYGAYDTQARTLRYASAGHPPALVLERPASAPISLGGSSLMIGAFSDTVYENHQRRLPSGARLYLFSDGVFEVHAPSGQMLGLDGLVRLIAEAPDGDGPRVEHVQRQVQAFQGAAEFTDDFSLVEFAFR